MNKLTFKDVAHLYIGCKMIDVETNEIGVLTHVDNTQTISVNDEIDYHPYESKPALRPLSDMTDVELNKCGNMICDFSKYPRLSKHEWSDFYDGFLHPLQFHYLISHHFDLFGLIESGEAIDATILTPNPYKP